MTSPEGLNVEEISFINEPLVEREKIVFPPLHIKLANTQYRELDTESDCFKYLCEVFPGITFEKLKAGNVDGPQTRMLIKDQAFTRAMTDIQTKMHGRHLFVL